MNLEQLNLAEQQLLIKVKSATGLIEDKILQLEQNNTFTEYDKIYEKYVELLESKIEWLEALKRSLFLLWYEQSEPPCFSGLSGLSVSASRKVFNFLEQQIESERIDSELKLMLQYYNEISEWVFNELIDEWVFKKKTNLPNLIFFLANTKTEIELNNLNADNFRERGQMGKYWTSISQRKSSNLKLIYKK